VPRPVDTPALTEVSAVLEGLSGTVTSIEDDLLSCLVVMGEPDPQRAVDAWVDQVVDLLRAVDEVTGQHLSTLSRVSTRLGESDSTTDLTSVERARATLPVEHP
jgi:hypothetical protein